jgi:carbon-monoxide dehydrogenase medium subunit
MIPAQFEYAAPDSVAEVIALLKHSKGARILAGGHDLLPRLKLRQLSAPLLIDLRNISDLAGIAQDSSGNSAHIGAMSTCTTIAADEWVQANALALVEAANSIGDVQVRNWSTIGGNLAYGHPAADLPPALLVLEASIQVNGPDGQRTLVADQFFLGAFETALHESEIITSIDLFAPAGKSSSVYEKFRIPSNNYPLCGVAARVDLAADGSIAGCRVAVTGVTDSPCRLSGVEDALKGKMPSSENIAQASSMADQGINFTTDLYGTGVYRAHLTKVLTERALTRAAKQAGED